MEKGSGGRTELKHTPRPVSLVGGLDRPALAVIAGHAANPFGQRVLTK
jgi:hypothetical protein